MKLSIIIPVYFNEMNIGPLYEDIKTKVLDIVDFDCEIIMVDDGSEDGSWEAMRRLKEIDNRVHTYRLSKNFGSHAAILCGLAQSSGDCAVIKAADLQEPSETILDMVEKWRQGNNVVLGIRARREESAKQKGFADLYYWLVRKTAFPSMPKHGFDVYLIDRKVKEVLLRLDNTNSALTGQILWTGFKTGTVEYTRKAREIGESRWTLKKKIHLVADTLFSFSTTPIKLVECVGAIAFLGAMLWACLVLVLKLLGEINVDGWTTLFIFSLLSFGIIMMTLGILGEYLWRTYESSRGRPPYIIETYDRE